MVICLDGVGEITIDDEKYTLKPGETIIMPARRPHAVFAKEQFKMFLIVVFHSKRKVRLNESIRGSFRLHRLWPV